MEEFKELISELSGEPVENIKEDSSFRDDLAIDSLQMVNMIVQVASRFNLELLKVKSIHDLETVGRMFAIFEKGEMDL